MWDLPVTVFQASSLASANHQFAVKIGHTGLNHCLLEHEHHVLTCLHGVLRIPQSLWFGQELECNVLVLSLLGPSLQDIFNLCEQSSLTMTALIAEQMVHFIPIVSI